MTEPAGAATLRQILISLGEAMLEMQVAPSGLDVEVRDVVICDPDDAPDLRPHDLALVVGARGRAAVASVRAAGERGASAVAVKVVPGRGASRRSAPLVAAATDAGIALLAVPAEVRWGHLEALARDVLAGATQSGPDEAGGVRTDLFGLAQTVATVTGGHVSIEDTANRVVAYSSTGDEVDELRRLSILGRQGPEPYLKLLREWGVYDRLRASDAVVRVEARPELGIRERLAVGVHAGARVLGTIWLAEGGEPLAERAERALVGAGRVAATQLAQRRREPDVGLRFRESLLAGLLDGRMDADSVAAQIGADPGAACAVVAFGAVGADHADRSQVELLRAEMINLISVHAAALRRTALVTPLGGRIYVLLPDLGAPDGARSSVLGFARDVAAGATRDLRAPIRAGVGSVVDTVSGALGSRAEADRVLDVIAAEQGAAVASIEEVRADVLLAETVALLRANPAVRDPRVTALCEHDARHHGELVATVLSYLDAFGDVRVAAAQLGVHPNTVRYRLRRACAVSGMDMHDPKQRLFAQLQLRLSPA